jgi:molybdenum cofactor synthesis domain-containing protein
MERTAAAIVIGDEVLSGKVRDANGPYLIDRLRAAGIRLGRLLTVGDDPDEIGWAVHACRGRFAPIVTSGGIGPTHDDVTVPAVARALGRRIVRSPEIEAGLRARRGAALPEAALRLAEIPDGATLVQTPGTWFPVIEVDGFYLLPGIPELFRMHLDALAERHAGPPFALRCVYLSCGETAIAATLDRVVAAHRTVAIGSYPRLDAADHRVKLTVESRDPAAVDAAIAALLAALPGDAVVRVE